MRYEIVETPGPRWRIVENTSNGMKFHGTVFRTPEAAQERLTKLDAAHRLANAVADVRKRARMQCECMGECGQGHGIAAPSRSSVPRCMYADGMAAPGGAIIKLTVVALNFDDDDVRAENLRAYCQFCRQHYDAQRAGGDALFEVGQ